MPSPVRKFAVCLGIASLAVSGCAGAQASALKSQVPSEVLRLVSVEERDANGEKQSALLLGKAYRSGAPNIPAETFADYTVGADVRRIWASTCSAIDASLTELDNVPPVSLAPGARLPPRAIVDGRRYDIDATVQGSGREMIRVRLEVSAGPIATWAAETIKMISDCE